HANLHGIVQYLDIGIVEGCIQRLELWGELITSANRCFDLTFHHRRVDSTRLDQDDLDSESSGLAPHDIAEALESELPAAVGTDEGQGDLARKRADEYEPAFARAQQRQACLIDGDIRDRVDFECLAKQGKWRSFQWTYGTHGCTYGDCIEGRYVLRQRAQHAVRVGQVQPQDTNDPWSHRPQRVFFPGIHHRSRDDVPLREQLFRHFLSDATRGSDHQDSACHAHTPADRTLAY